MTNQIETEIIRVLKLEIEALNRRNEQLQSDLITLERDSERWRTLAIATQQKLEALRYGERPVDC